MNLDGLHQASYLSYQAFCIEDSIWFIIMKQYRFQLQNVYNQMEDVLLSLLHVAMRQLPTGGSLSVQRSATREGGRIDEESDEEYDRTSITKKGGTERVTASGVGVELCLAIIEEYHSRLFDNYIKWCDFIRAEPFPWRELPWQPIADVDDRSAEGGGDSTAGSHRTGRQEELSMGNGLVCDVGDEAREVIQQMMYEIVLFKLIWGECANIRHTPELLCWLFHWLMMAWDIGRTPEEDFVDVIRVIIQRMRDEQWRLEGTMRAPDHSGRMLYDDINEVYWDSGCLAELTKAAKIYIPAGLKRREAQTRDHAPLNKSEGLDDNNRMSVTGHNLAFFFGKVMGSEVAGKGVKTFVERRSYLQVIRCFWRVFAAHAVSFYLLLAFHCFLSDDLTSVRGLWTRAILTASLCGVCIPLMDAVLMDFKRMRRRHFWTTVFQRCFIDVIRIGFCVIVVMSIAEEGWEAPSLHWRGPVGGSYVLFYLCHGMWPFLFIRVFGYMPFFSLIWSLPVIRVICKPVTYTASVPLCAEDFLKVVHYTIFWIPVIAGKIFFWLYGIIPLVVRSSEYVSLVTWRPYYIFGFAAIVDPHKVLLRICLWLPVFLVWLFDLQIFFLLLGAVYGSIIGYGRRVGYFKSLRMIQKRLIPMLPSVPLFEVHKPIMEGPHASAHRTTTRDRFQMSPTHATTHTGAHSHSRGGGNRGIGHGSSDPRMSGGRGQHQHISYSNMSDPYTRMLPALRSSNLAHNTAFAGPVDEESKQRKRFGFVWNEILRSWRVEDVISNQEYVKLEFNEMPRLFMLHDDWSTLRDGKGHCAVLWERSVVRLPVYIYCDVLPTLLKKCESFQIQINDDMARFKSKGSLAQQFFNDYFSDDPKHQDPRFQNSLHIEAIREVSEALFIFIARYFDCGADLVESITALWDWIRENGSRLEWINLQGLKELRTVLIAMFNLLQKVTTFAQKDEDNLKQNVEKLRKSLLALVRLPSSATFQLPAPLQTYTSAVDQCFSSPYTSCLPPVAAPSVPPAELQDVVAKVLYEADQRQQLEKGCTEHQNPQAPPGSLPMTLDRIATLRALLKLYCMAYLEKLKRNNDRMKEGIEAEDDGFDGVGHTHVWVIEHSIRMYFRRAAKILQATNPRLETSEGTRRLKFFVNSLLMKMPETPEVHRMVSLCTMTPYYREDAMLDLTDIERPTAEGVTKMELLRSLHLVEFSNFLERVDRDGEMFRIHQELESRVAESPKERMVAIEEVREHLLNDGLLHRYDKFCEALQQWASNRGQVLSRTVRGIMYCEQALQMQAYVEGMMFEDLHLSHDSNRLDTEQLKAVWAPDAQLWWNLLQTEPMYKSLPGVRSIAHQKFQYIVAAQEFGTDNQAQPPKSRNQKLDDATIGKLQRKAAIYKLLNEYSNLRIATIEPEKDASGRPTGRKCSVLYRLTTDSTPEELEDEETGRRRGVFAGIPVGAGGKVKNSGNQKIHFAEDTGKCFRTSKTMSDMINTLEAKLVTQSSKHLGAPSLFPRSRTSGKLSCPQHLDHILGQHPSSPIQQFSTPPTFQHDSITQAECPTPRDRQGTLEEEQSNIGESGNTYRLNITESEDLPTHLSQDTSTSRTFVHTRASPPPPPCISLSPSWQLPQVLPSTENRTDSSNLVTSINPHSLVLPSSIKLPSGTVSTISSPYCYSGNRLLTPSYGAPSPRSDVSNTPHSTITSSQATLAPSRGHSYSSALLVRASPVSSPANSMYGLPSPRYDPCLAREVVAEAHHNHSGQHWAPPRNVYTVSQMQHAPPSPISPNVSLASFVSTAPSQAFHPPSAPSTHSTSSPPVSSPLIVSSASVPSPQLPQRLSASRLEAFENPFAIAASPNRQARPATVYSAVSHSAPPPAPPQLARLDEMYRIRLPVATDAKGLPWPRYPIIGPGKPENQNAAMVFTRGETLQAMDMNMDYYLEEAIKLRNLLQEFTAEPRMRILGFREHIFTQNVSSLAAYMALQENLFTTTNQRLYHVPLHVRMHYGHPDMFDRFFVQTCGSLSKASNGINLSEDVFAGYNCTARGFTVKQVDYIQCGKGRDVGLQQVYLFEKKIASGNAEQVLSRDLRRLAGCMDPVRLFSLYYAGPGFFLNSLVIVGAALVTLYAKVLAAMAEQLHHGVLESYLKYVIAPTTYIQFQLGLLLILPLFFYLILEQGLDTAYKKLIELILKLAVLYYNFMIGTKSSVIDHVLVYGGAKYQETGRGFVIAHANFVTLWRFYYFTHFQVALEMIMLLSIYARFSGFDVSVYFLDAWPFWLMALSFLWVPFVFNPLGLYYPRLLHDFGEWNKWVRSQDLSSDSSSWLAWWRTEMESRCGVWWHNRLLLVVRIFRFLLLASGLLSIVASKYDTSDFDTILYMLAAYGVVFFITVLLGDLKLANPFWNSLLSLLSGIVVVGVLGWAIIVGKLTVGSLIDVIAALFIFVFGAVEIAMTLLGRWAVRHTFFHSTLRVYHIAGGYIVFLPPFVISAFTLSFNKLQNRVLFNPNFVQIVKSGIIQRAEVLKRGHAE
eukprot:GHVQ01026787.1.p1 GENE.GHVQ01026787.1~~GHVQ01026787.1.p1  ORF type:complete len:2671 (-),score=335.52 GHVQ01026787.1:3360-10901(-)